MTVIADRRARQVDQLALAPVLSLVLALVRQVYPHLPDVRAQLALVRPR